MTRNSMLFGSRSSTRIKPMFPTGRILHKIMSMMLSLFEEKKSRNMLPHNEKSRYKTENDH